MVTRHAVERQLHPVDSTLPYLWLSDGWWSWQREVYNLGGRAWFFLTLEKKIRKLARRCKSKPRHFEAALNRTMKHHAKKLGMPWVENDAPTTSSLQGLSQRQLSALANFIPTMQQVFHGGPEVAKSLEPRPKQILSFFRAFAARPAGRGRVARYDDALKLFVSGEKKYHQICLKTNPLYASMNRDQQNSERNRMRSALKRRLLKLASETSLSTK